MKEPYSCPVNTAFARFALLIFTAILFMTSQTAGAQSWVSRIRPDHPRLFLNSDTLPAVRNRALNQERSTYNTLKSRADSYNPSSVKDWGKEAAFTALVYLVDGDTTYLNKVKTMLSQSITYYNQCISSGRAVDWHSNSRVHWLTAYDWIYNDLTATERRTLMTGFMNFMDRVLPNPSWPSLSNLNNRGVHSGFYDEKNILWFMGLAAYGDGIDDSRALDYLVEGYNLNQQHSQLIQDVVKDDGGQITACIPYALGPYVWAQFNFMYTWESATGEDLASKWTAMAYYPEWIMWNWIEGDYPRVFGTGDGYHYDMRLINWQLYTTLSNVMHFYWDVNPEMAARARWIRENMPEGRYYNLVDYAFYPMIMTGIDRCPPAVDPRNDNLHARHFENVGQIIMRSGAGPDDTYMMFNSGSTVTGHKQYDENNFIIYKNGYLALDSGTRDNYHWTHYMSQTVAHNTVLVHMPNEPFGGYGARYPGPEGQINYGGQYLQTGGRTVAFETNNVYSYAAGDATGTYRSSKVSLFLRQIVYIRPEHFVIFDRVNSTDASYRKEWLLHTQNEPVMNGKQFRADDENGRMFVQSLYPADARLEKIGGPGQEFVAAGRNWALQSSSAIAEKPNGKMGNWRVEIEPGTARTNDTFLNIIQVGDQSLSQMDQAELIQGSGFIGVRIVHEDTVSEVTFNTSGNHGGHVKVTRGTNVLIDKDLATSVTPQGGNPDNITDAYFAPGQASGGEPPAIQSVTLSPDSGWLSTGDQVTITVREEQGQSGMTASNATINGVSVPLADAWNGAYVGTYTVQANHAQGVNIEAAGITLSNGEETTPPASSSGSTLRVDTRAPAIQSVNLSPNSGVLSPGNQVGITVTAANNETGLIPSDATFASGRVPLSEIGAGRYGGTYTITASDADGAASSPAATVFADGFESGIDDWTTVSSGITTSSDAAVGGSSVSYSVNSTDWAALMKELGADYTETWTSFHFKLDPSFTMPDGASQFLTVMHDNSGVMPWSLRLSRNGSRYAIRLGADSAGRAIEHGRWYEIKIHLKSTADGTLEWWVDDALVERFPADWSAAPSGKLYGIVMSGVAAGTSGTLYWDDFRISETDGGAPIVLEATGITLTDAAGNVSQTASSSESNLSVVGSGDGGGDSTAPSIASVNLSPDSGWLSIGDQVTITVREASGLSGLTPSNTVINGESVPLADAGNGIYTGLYTVTAGCTQGVNIEATGITLSNGAATSSPASSSGSTLRVDTHAPAVQSVTLSPSTGEVHPGETVDITVTAAGGESGLTVSNAAFAGGSVPLTGQGGGIYQGSYMVTPADTAYGSSAPAAVFSDGFENSIGDWTTVSSGIATGDDAAMGSRSVSYTVNSTAWAAMLKELGRDYDETWTSLYFKLDTSFTMPDGASQFVTAMHDYSGVMPWSLRLSRSGNQYTLRLGENSEGISLEHGRWYKIEVHLKSTTDGMLEWWVDDTLMERFPGDWSTAPAGKLYGVIMSGVADGTSGTLCWDDFRVTTSSQDTPANLEATGVRLTDAAGNVSAAASSLGSRLNVTIDPDNPNPEPQPVVPQIASVTLSPNSGWLKAGSTVTITAREASGATGLTASNARINGRSVPLTDVGSGRYRGVYTVQAGDTQGANIEATNIRLTTVNGVSSDPASSSGSTLSVDTSKPAIDQVALRVPAMKLVGLGQQIDIIVYARNEETGLIASDALVNNRMIPLAGQGDGTYRGIYVVQEGDAGVDSLRAENVVLTDAAGNASDTVSSPPSGISVTPDAVVEPAVADFNADGVVDFSDFVLFAANYGWNSTEPDFDARYDLNGDDSINVIDFSLFASAFTVASKQIGAAKPARFPESSAIFIQDAMRTDDSVVTVRIGVSETARLDGFECILTYDPTRYEPMGETVEGLVGISLPVVSNGAINLASMFLDETFGGSVEIQFRIVGEGSDTIELNRVRTAENGELREPRLVQLVDSMPVIITDAGASPQSRHVVSLDWAIPSNAQGAAEYAVEILRGTDNGNSELVGVKPVDPVTVSGMLRCRISELEPGNPYQFRLVCFDGVDTIGVSRLIQASTHAGITSVDYDAADPYIEEDSGSPVTIGASTPVSFEWSSWEPFGADSYRVIVRNDDTDTIFAEEVIRESNFTFTPHQTRRYSLEVLPLTGDGEAIGRIGASRVTIVPARYAAPGKPTIKL